ncbi:MAG: M56 family metallopeptidase [Anaerolineae bacterium]|nr:M56 family metallopeptidase [Gemmatimonadaceae bacterium]
MSGESALFSIISLSAALIAWIATYAVHSTLALGGAWLLLRGKFADRVGPEVRELIWKAALLTGIVTASAQSAQLVSPAFGTFDISRTIELKRWNGMSVIPPVHEVLEGTGATVFGGRMPDAASLLRIVPVLLLAAWSIYAALVIWRVLLATMTARARLGVRHDTKDAFVREEFARIAESMKLRNPVRLTQSAHVSSPVVLGSDEICVPERLLTELSTDEQQSVLAHEAAHLLRGDPKWLLCAATIESIFFFQPLNRMARMRLQDEAEYLADDLAVRYTKNSVALARCLARVAVWVTDGSSESDLLAPALAERRSSLLQRVQRLITLMPSATAGNQPRVATRAFAVVLPLAVLLAAPAFSGGDVRAWGTPAFHWEGILAPGGTVEIQGLMGNIRAEPSTGSSVVVNATRHGRATNPDITFQVIQHSGGVAICAVYPVPKGHSPNECVPGSRRGHFNTPANDIEVEFLVLVPKGIGFSAHSATGNVTTGRLSGPVKAHSSAGRVSLATESYASASTGSGDVDIEMGSSAWPGTLRVQSLSGNIAVRLPAPQTRR